MLESMIGGGEERQTFEPSSILCSFWQGHGPDVKTSHILTQEVGPGCAGAECMLTKYAQSIGKQLQRARWKEPGHGNMSLSLACHL